jgi:hypothetical protein
MFKGVGVEMGYCMVKALIRRIPKMHGRCYETMRAY